MEPTTIPFQPKLPARIAGIVFWVLVLVCLTIAVYFLNKTLDETNAHRESSAYLLAHEVEFIISQAQNNEESADALNAKLTNRIRYLQEIIDFTAISIDGVQNPLEFGVSNADDSKYEYQFTYRESATTTSDQVKVEVYFTNIDIIIAEIRKNMLMGIGIGILLFGFFLRYVLHIILTRPFISMLESAKSFTLGNEAIRFHENRQDEFGYLGRFINHAIESVLDQQEALRAALARASSSEAALSVEKERAEVTLNSITDSVLTVDENATVIFVNPAAEKLLERSRDELVGKGFFEVLSIVDDFSKKFEVDLIKKCFSSGEVTDFPAQSSLLKNGSDLVAVEASVAPMKNQTGELIGAVVVIQDVSHTRSLTRQLSYQASHDTLTGLYNRRMFESHLQEILANVKSENRQHVLLYLDLDQFKIVNDTCGHIAGDELLQQLPLLFHRILRSGDTIARLGGDEFGVLLENCSLKKSVTIAEKIREQIKDFRFVWKGNTFEIGVSVGVVEINADNIDMTNILSTADIACYAAKDAGRNRVHVYEESDVVVSRRHGEMHWTTRITNALNEDRFCLYHQKIVNLKSGAVEHTEILLRMIGEDGSIILPGAFLPAAERFNLMVAIDRWVISHVFQVMKQCASKQVAEPINIVAINLSGDSLSDDGLLDFICSEKDKYQISMDRVCFEITETVAISNLTQAVYFIEQLKQHGCKFSLDDFGSGLSSFAYLKTLPVNYLKIDGSFVRDISKCEIDRAMVKSIQQVARAMKLKTVAEWVEDEQTLNILKELGVDCAQGNYLMPAGPIACGNCADAEPQS